MVHRRISEIQVLVVSQLFLYERILDGNIPNRREPIGYPVSLGTLFPYPSSSESRRYDTVYMAVKPGSSMLNRWVGELSL